ncbi:MAG: hypothetical protein WAM91_11195 [Candidatus Acidiferrales bacterium]
MRTDRNSHWAPYRTVGVVLAAVLLIGAGKLLATYATPREGAVPSPQTPCPTQADCDRLKQIADAAAAAATAAHAVADQAQADRDKDLAAANQLDREAEFPSSPITREMRTSDKLEIGAAKHAQAKGLRDKLPNAQANAKAADEAAAAALKAYNDCIQKLKDCPPPSKATQTGTTGTTTGTGIGTSTGTGDGGRGGRGGRGADSTRVEILDGTTSSTVLPLKLEYKLETGLSFGWYGGPKDSPYPPKDIYRPPTGYLNGQTGSLELGMPWDGGFNTPWMPNGTTFFNPPLVTPTPPDSGSRLGRFQFPVLRPRDTYIRPLIYRDYNPQLMDYFGWGIPSYHCENDFPYELQKLMGITTAQCRPSKPPRVIAGRSEPAPERAQLQTVSLRTGMNGVKEQSSGQSGSGQSSSGQGVTGQGQGQGRGRGQRRPRVMPTEGFSYSIVSNGKSTGEAFQLQVVDPTGKVKSVQMQEGTVLEAIRPGVTQPVTAGGGANLVKQPLNGFCLEFDKQPPAEGTMYRIADEETQQKYSSLRYLSGAGAQMKQKNMFHPDSNPAAYDDAIMQYAAWVKLNGWTLVQFIQHFIERTKKNADAMKVKWTSEMEATLRNAAPGRWRDISEMVQEAQDLEKAAEGRRGGRGGRGGRRGGRGTQPER